MIFFFTKFTISDHLTLSPTVQTAFSFNVQIVKQHIIIFYRSFVSLVNTIQPGPTTTVQIELIESLTILTFESPILTDLSLSPLSAVVSLEHRRAKPRSWRPSTSAPSGTDAGDSSLACCNRTASTQPATLSGCLQLRLPPRAASTGSTTLAPERRRHSSPSLVEKLSSCSVALKMQVMLVSVGERVLL